MTPEHFQSGAEFIVYDAERINQPWSGMFDPRWWRDHHKADAIGGGRGAAWRVERDGRAFALRHYRRGGFPARFIDDRYLWTGLEATRAYREWRLLAELAAAGLPVTPPVAARVLRHGVGYTADLLTSWIDGAQSLPRLLAVRPLRTEEWVAIGRTLRRFHDAGAYHADLNAGNILLDGAGRVFLADFDRGERRMQAPRWQRANLARLERSLKKLDAAGATPHYEADSWNSLRAGYSGDDHG